MKSINKILLIQPPYTITKGRFKVAEPPLGLAYIASVLEHAGYKVAMLDSVVEGFTHSESLGSKSVYYGLPFSEIKKRIELFYPDVVGVSCLFFSLLSIKMLSGYAH